MTPKTNRTSSSNDPAGATGGPPPRRGTAKFLWELDDPLPDGGSGPQAEERTYVDGHVLEPGSAAVPGYECVRCGRARIKPDQFEEFACEEGAL